MNQKKAITVVLAILLTVGGASALNQEYRTGTDWSNAADYSGVTWDGIQDHPNNTLTQGYQYGSITEGLVAYYSFEDKKGKVIDQALNNDGVFKGVNTGNLSNFDFDEDSGWVEGHDGKGHALEFSQGNERVSINDSESLKIDNQITISAWVYKDTNGWYWIAEKGEGQSGEYLLGSPWNSNGVQFRLRDSSGSIIGEIKSDKLGGIPLKDWTHVAATFSQGTMKTFVNGELQVSKDIGATWDGSNNANLTIGYKGTGGTGAWDGKIDEVKIYNKSLSNSQINSLYNGENVNRSSLVAEYGFDTGHGEKAYDTSQWQRGKLGDYSGEFKRDDYVEVSEPNTGIKDEVSVSAWVKPRNVSVSNNYIVTKRGASNSIAYHLALEGDGAYRWHLEKGAFDDIANIRAGNWTDNVGEWIHVTGTYNGQIAKIYRNGELIGSEKGTGTLDQNPGPLCLGSNGCENRFLNGSLDSVRIYDRGLSSKEVNKLYSRNREQEIGPSDTLQSGLVGWWPLHETTGQTAEDLSGYGNDGTLGNSTLGDDAEPTQGVAGVGGKTAYSFDGKDDDVRANLSQKITGNDFSTATWVKLDVKPSEQRDYAKLITLQAESDVRAWTQVSSNLKFTAGMRNESGFGISSGEPRSDMPPEENEWYHVSSVSNGDTLKLYVNGVMTEKRERLKVSSQTFPQFI